MPVSDILHQACCPCFRLSNTSQHALTVASAAVATADFVNIGLCVTFDVTILYFLGIKSLLYLALGSLMGGGLHPMAGHLIAEHYMFLKVPCALSLWTPDNFLNSNSILFSGLNA